MGKTEIPQTYIDDFTNSTFSSDVKKAGSISESKKRIKRVPSVDDTMDEGIL
jgi:hypothetical protein